MRPAAARELSAQDTPSVFYIRPGSPADKADIKVGDELIHDDKPVSATHHAMLTNVKETGLLTLRRGEEIVTAVISPEDECAYNLRLKTTSVINAYADGRNITFTTGMIDFVKNDDELAMIVGHELAHNTEKHIRKILTNAILTAYRKRYTRPFEAEADYVGLYYMARAGYDLAGVEDFWDRLSTISNPKYIAKANTHPSYPQRALFIAATRDEIQTKQQSGVELLPNRKGGS